MAIGTCRAFGIMTRWVMISQTKSITRRGVPMKRVAVFVFALVLALAMAVPAFAAGADGAGRDFGKHHATHAQEMGGFTGAMNPGVMHQGFAGWTGE